jgi:hypothetical protein
VGGLQGQVRLADASGAGQGEETHLWSLQKALESGQFLLPP